MCSTREHSHKHLSTISDVSIEKGTHMLFRQASAAAVFPALTSVYAPAASAPGGDAATALVSAAGVATVSGTLSDEYTGQAESRIRSTVFEMSMEVAARTLAALLLGAFACDAWVRWQADPSRITLLLFAFAGCLTVGLSLFTHVPKRRDWRPFAFLCSIGGTYYFLAVSLAPGVSVIPELAGAALQIVGLFCQLFAKLSLRRSFGILPANRGVVSYGAYRFVRHPMYLGYLITDIGFLLSNFGVQNLIVYGVQFALQAGRIIKEEQLLSADAQYVRYAQSVRYRILPGLF